jgi:stress-induced morphogen
MSQATEPRWHTMRTEETNQVEEILRPFFPDSDAYRFNSASIRVRVIDPRFEGKSNEERDSMVEPLLSKLPESIQADIMNLLTMTPDEASNSLRKQFANLEFEDPSRNML